MNPLADSIAIPSMTATLEVAFLTPTFLYLNTLTQALSESCWATVFCRELCFKMLLCGGVW